MGVFQSSPVKVRFSGSSATAPASGFSTSTLTLPYAGGATRLSDSSATSCSATLNTPAGENTKPTAGSLSSITMILLGFRVRTSDPSSGTTSMEKNSLPSCVWSSIIVIGTENSVVRAGMVTETATVY